MGAINYRKSDYITMGYNCNTEYVFDDFWKDETEQREFEISFLQDEVNAELKEHSFYYFHVEVKPGYYEGFSIDIENNFTIAFDTWQDKKEAQKEITEIKQFLLACAKLGLVKCLPGWSTGYCNYSETVEGIKDAIKLMRIEVKNTPTISRYNYS